MRITNRDRLKMARFGCAFLAQPKLICISWEKERQNQAVSANIVCRLVHAPCTSGPLLFLAFEISPTKVLPQYCFFPFDLTNKTHRNYLCSVFKNRRIQLCFLAGSRPITRTYELLPSQCARFPELYAMADADLRRFPPDQYNFDYAVRELERTVRLPVDCFGYIISETDLQRLADSCKTQAATLSPEDRAQAARITHDLLEVFRKRYDAYIREQIKQLAVVTRGFLLFSDLQREFEGNYAAFAQFATDLITANPGYRDFEKLIPFFEAGLTLLDQMRSTPSEANDASRAQLETGLREITDAVTSGLGLPIGLLKDILSKFGIQLRRPGRTPEDYSSEYALKAKGLSWSALTEHALENDPETRREFGGRKYDELTIEEKERLENRIRQGVRSYAERAGKPWPLQ